MTKENCRDNALEESRRGNECLAEAEYLLKGGFYNAAVSRACYAEFLWGLALLIVKGLEPKTHRVVIQLLQLHYAESGDLSSEAATALGQLETYRELSDYNAKANFDEKRASAEIQRTRMFVDSCRPLIP